MSLFDGWCMLCDDLLCLCDWDGGVIGVDIDYLGLDMCVS